MMMAGGSAVNSATHLAALVRMDATNETRPVIVHSTIQPNDEYGKLILNHMETHGIPFINCLNEKIDTTTASTGHCIVIVANDERSFMTHPGVIEGFSATSVQFDTMVQEIGPIHVHIAGFYNIQGFWSGALLEHIQRLRREREQLTCVSLVTQHDATGKWDGGLLELLPLLDFVFMNELEAKYITKQNEDDDKIKHWVQFFSLAASATCVIVTRGDLGAIAIRNGKIIAVQAAVKIVPIDPTGAGDAFCSGFLKGIWDWRRRCPSINTFQEWPPQAIQNGLIHGCGIATCSVLTRGASVPSDPMHIQDFLRRTKSL
jgi:sugar/nucleoside kinase (ribokinase family)